MKKIYHVITDIQKILIDNVLYIKKFEEDFDC